MRFKHIDETIASIKDTKKINAIEQHLLSLRSELLNYDFIIDVIQSTKKKYTDNLEDFIKGNIENYKQAKAETENKLNDEVLSTEEREHLENVLESLKELTDVKTWEEIASLEKTALEFLEHKLTNDNFIENELYKNIIYFLTSDKETIENFKAETLKNYISILTALEVSKERILKNYLDKQNIKSIDDKVNTYIYASNNYIDKKLNKDKISTLTFNTAMITGAYFDFKTNINELYEIYYDYLEDEEKQQEKFKRAYLEYDNTSTYSLSEFSKALINNPQTSYNLIEKKLSNIEVILSPSKESKEIIEGLGTLEKRVIDIITSLYMNNITRFTDRQIAHVYYGKDTKITDDKLTSINNAIDKARKTFIEIKGNVKDKKEKFFNSRNPFIHLTQLGVKDDTSKTQYYQIEGTPFYYTYILRTGGNFITYDTQELTKQIQGINISEKTQTLKVYLQEKISNMSLGEEKPYISLENIYNTDYGNGKADTRKKRFNTTYYVETFLNELRHQYNFKYETDLKGKSKKGYKITFNSKM